MRTELNCKVTHLALAWVARKPNTGTVILGASKPEQVLDNLKALDVIDKLTPEIEAKIEEILANEPKPDVSLTSLYLHFTAYFLDYYLQACCHRFRRHSDDLR